jgi:thiamine phosphate synthase YjbQ (UPF0047 family)
MTATVSALRLELRPSRRPEAIDLRGLLVDALQEGPLQASRRLLCISHHTTAGFLDRRLRERLGDDPTRLGAFLEALGSVFPPDAGYEHDRLHLRDELTELQKESEPLNADAHLAFIGGGFTNCTTLQTDDLRPLWFVDLDGVYRDRQDMPIRRTRHATVVGFEQEERVGRLRLEVPVPAGAGVVRLDDPEHPVLLQVQERVEEEGISAGRVGIRLANPAPGVGITVNEFEALLMERDLTRVLANPLGFARSGAQALTGALAALGVPSDRLRRLLDRALAHPATRVLRMQHHVSLGVLPPNAGTPGDPWVDTDAPGTLVRGTYQSPLLVQRRGTAEGRRALDVTLYRFR